MYESHISSNYSIFISLQMIMVLVFILFSLAVRQKSEYNLLSATAYSAGKLAFKLGWYGWNAWSWGVYDFPTPSLSDETI